MRAPRALVSGEFRRLDVQAKTLETSEVLVGDVRDVKDLRGVCGLCGACKRISHQKSTLHVQSQNRPRNNREFTLARSLAFLAAKRLSFCFYEVDRPLLRTKHADARLLIAVNSE